MRSLFHLVIVLCLSHFNRLHAQAPAFNWGLQINPAPMIIYGWGGEIQPVCTWDNKLSFAIGYSQVQRKYSAHTLSGNRFSATALWKIAEVPDVGQYLLGLTYRYRYLEANAPSQISSYGTIIPASRERSYSHYISLTNTFRLYLSKRFGTDIALHLGAKRSYHPDEDDVSTLINYYLINPPSHQVKWTANALLSVHFNFWLNRWND